MGVLYAQSKRNRVVSKHGKLNTFVRPDEKEEQHRSGKITFLGGNTPLLYWESSYPFRSVTEGGSIIRGWKIFVGNLLLME